MYNAVLLDCVIVSAVFQIMSVTASSVGWQKHGNIHQMFVVAEDLTCFPDAYSYGRFASGIFKGHWVHLAENSLLFCPQTLTAVGFSLDEKSALFIACKVR